MSTESVMLFNHMLCHPLLLLPSIFPSIMVFSDELTLHIRWPEHCSFSFCISLPMNIQSWFLLRLIGWFPCSPRDSQESFQQHNSKASILQLLAFFMVQLLHPYMTTGKTIVLTIWTFVDKVLSLLLNTLSRSVRAFLPRSKCVLIFWLQSPSAVILEPKIIKSVTASTFSPSICHEVTGPDVIILVFWMLSFKPAFSLSSFTLIKRLFSCPSLSAIRVVYRLQRAGMVWVLEFDGNTAARTSLN